ncbi:MAG TPA: ABC transporter substrate-binding protein [Hyphomicrobiales bacterium]|nr:ABC transporter substrate-binding protein [Hyphomicrobiales bacterium]
MNRLGKLAAGALAAFGVAALAAAPSAQAKDLKVGVVASLSGAFAGPAKDALDGVKAWIAARGVPGGKVDLVLADDETNPVTAANAFRRVASDPSVDLIYLLIPSNSVLAVKAIASDFKVPIIAGGAADAIGVPANPWLFKVAPGVHDFMTVLVNYAKSKGYKRIATLNATDAFGQAEIVSLRQLVPAAGLTLAAAESFAVTDTNFNAQAIKLRAANPDLVYDGASGRPAVLTFKQIKQLGLKAPLMMGQSVVAKSFYDGIGGAKVADGVLVPIQLGSFGTAAGGTTATMYGDLEKALGRTPVYYNTFGWDVGLITEAAVKNSDGSRQGLRDAIEKLKDLPALNGPVTYTAADHTGQNFRSIGMGQLENGVPVLVK